jgi:hypothetical protein
MFSTEGRKALPRELFLSIPMGALRLAERLNTCYPSFEE